MVGREEGFVLLLAKPNSILYHSTTVTPGFVFDYAVASQVCHADKRRLRAMPSPMRHSMNALGVGTAEVLRLIVALSR